MLSDMSNIVLEAQKISKVYITGKEKIEVLRELNLRIREGDMVGIFGPSGSGKTTLLNLLGAIDTPTEGKVLFEGKDLSSMKDEELSLIRREKIGFVFQFFNLLPEFNTVENVMLPLIMKGFDGKKAYSLACQILERVGMENRIHHRVEELSGGEAQRVAVARAIAKNPMIVLADEPTGNLDRKNAFSLMELFQKLNEETKSAFLVVSHNESLKGFFGRRLRLEEGRIKEID